MYAKIFLRSLTLAILTLLLINTIIFAFAFIKAKSGTDWSMAFKHLTYYVNGNQVDLVLDQWVLMRF
jgi:ABC-type spermidine/putrescine transport system permease subunit I